MRLRKTPLQPPAQLPITGLAGGSPRPAHHATPFATSAALLAAMETVMTFYPRAATLALALAFAASTVQAGVSPEKAALLDSVLTPVGAERAGNAEGTIPAWTKEVVEPPADWQPGERYTTPFPDAEPIFTITADNLDQYRDNLSPGQIALFERWPETYKMPVYETRRTAAKPQWIYDAIARNALTSELVANGEGVEGAAGGIPFPFPEATPYPAKAIIWNHKLRFRGTAVTRINAQVVTVPSGEYRLSKLREDILFNYNRKGVTPAQIGNLAIYFLQIVTDPPRLAGSILLVHETINQIAEPRRAWLYNPGLRRIRRAPNVAYDNPGRASDGLRTNDQLDMYNGATDRYNWELLGKKELYIPYNSYKLHNAQSYEAIVGPKHVNQDLTRYELHRVWVLEGKVKEGTSHIYARRVFYVDEDSWHIAVADLYDERGGLWRVMEGHTILAYGLPNPQPVMESSYDLFSSRYLLMALNNEEPEVVYGRDFEPDYFNPRNMPRQAVK